MSRGRANFVIAVVLRLVRNRLVATTRARRLSDGFLPQPVTRGLYRPLLR